MNGLAGHIKFEYNDNIKFRGKLPDWVKLLEVFKIEADALSKAFWRSTTAYGGVDKHLHFHECIPEGKVLVLLFDADDGYTFADVRQYTPKKYKFYMKRRGERFLVK
jgi:hypothetical protein